VLEGIEAIVFRTIGDRPPLRESRLPPELLRLPEELARVDALLDDPAFFAPFAPHSTRCSAIRPRRRNGTCG
jgi:IS5 family transposase